MKCKDCGSVKFEIYNYETGLLTCTECGQFTEGECDNCHNSLEELGCIQKDSGRILCYSCDDHIDPVFALHECTSRCRKLGCSSDL